MQLKFNVYLWDEEAEKFTLWSFFYRRENAEGAVDQLREVGFQAFYTPHPY